MKTPNFLVGTCSLGNIFENLNSPRPLLVVASGNTTIGLSACIWMSSNFKQDVVVAPYGGTRPVRKIISRREVMRNPRNVPRGEACRVEVMFAEPVPVRRPGVWLTIPSRPGVGVVTFNGSKTGRTKIGLNLPKEKILQLHTYVEEFIHTERPATAALSTIPNSTQ